MTLQLALNSNFVGQELALSALQQGQLEAVRESCGVLALLVLAVLAGYAEPLVGAAMLVLLAVGLAAYSVVHSFGAVLAMSFVWSQGLHVWMPLPGSMAMGMAEDGKKGHRLGQVGAAGAAGAAGGLVLAWGLHWLGVPIRPLWILSAAAALVAAGACLGIPRKTRADRPRLVIRRKYGLYYVLSFLEGWRKQIFVAFAGYLLVRNYGINLGTMLGLWICIQFAGWFINPLVGKWIDRVGERPVLSTYYGCMVLVFMGYVLVPHAGFLCALFVADSIFFSLGMALTTYVGRIAPSEEHTPTLSMGVAMNHVAAVIMPLAGGLLWDYISYQWLFVMGAAVAALSVAVALRVPVKARAEVLEPELAVPAA